jgi:uncharacterized membrane protein YphA (DoxX/SURF4 family)
VITLEGLAYSVLRIALGVPLLVSGAEKVVAAARSDTGFYDRLADVVNQPWIPMWVLGVGSVIIPVIELAIGLALVAGIYARWAAIAGIAGFAVALAAAELLDEREGAALEMVQLLLLIGGYFVVARLSDADDPLRVWPRRGTNAAVEDAGGG